MDLHEASFLSGISLGLEWRGGHVVGISFKAGSDYTAKILDEVERGIAHDRAMLRIDQGVIALKICGRWRPVHVFLRIPDYLGVMSMFRKSHESRSSRLSCNYERAAQTLVISLDFRRDFAGLNSCA